MKGGYMARYSSNEMLTKWCNVFTALVVFTVYICGHIVYLLRPLDAYFIMHILDVMYYLSINWFNCLCKLIYLIITIMPLACWQYGRTIMYSQ